LNYKLRKGEGNMDSKVFGRFIAEIRKEKNMTQADLAGIIGVTDKAISRWERGIGFPDINTLEPLAKALDLSVVELMRSQKSDMENKNQNLSESDVVELMDNAVKMTRENQRQDKISVWIGGIVTIIVAILVKMSGRANIGGSILVSVIIALAVVSIYFFTQNIEDKDSRKIYGFFMLVGISCSIKLFQLMGADSSSLTWGVYGILFVVICLISK